MRSPQPRPAEAPVAWRAGPARALAVAATGCLLVGLAAAGPVLSVPGAAGLALVALSGAWVRGLLTGAAVEVRPLAATVIEGQRLELRLAVSGAARWGGAAVLIEHGLLPAPLRLSGRTTRGSTSAGELRVALGARGRGEIAVGPGTLRIGDPFGLWEARRHGGGPTRHLLVLPRVVPVQWRVGARQLGLDPDVTVAAGAAAGAEIVGLREYRPGTPAGRIHWPSLARGAGLLERAVGGTVERTPLLVLDGRLGGDDPGRRDEFERLVRAVASLSRELALVGGVDVALPEGDRVWSLTPTLIGWDAVHRALARTRASIDGPGPTWGDAAAAERPIVLAAIDPVWPTGVMSASGPGAHRLELVPTPVAGAETLFSVAGCVGRLAGGGPR